MFGPKVVAIPWGGQREVISWPCFVFRLRLSILRLHVIARQMLSSSRSTARHAAPALRAAIRHMSGKDLRFGDEARALMLKGVDQLANAVQVRRPAAPLSARGQTSCGAGGIGACPRRASPSAGAGMGWARGRDAPGGWSLAAVAPGGAGRAQRARQRMGVAVRIGVGVRVGVGVGMGVGAGMGICGGRGLHWGTGSGRRLGVGLLSRQGLGADAATQGLRAGAATQGLGPGAAIHVGYAASSPRARGTGGLPG